MLKLVLLRHRQSLWSLENKFIGWTDVGLSDHGKLEACKAGQLLAHDEITADSMPIKGVTERTSDWPGGINIIPRFLE